MVVRLAFIHQNFMKVGVENHWLLNGIKIPVMRGRMEMLTSLESHRFNPVIQLLIVIFATRSEPVKYSTVKRKHFLAVFLCFAKIIRESCVEKYKKFNGVDFSSTRARVSFEAGMNSPNLPRHVNITALKHRSRFGEVPCFREMQAFFGSFGLLR